MATRRKNMTGISRRKDPPGKTKNTLSTPFPVEQGPDGPDLMQWMHRVRVIPGERLAKYLHQDQQWAARYHDRVTAWSLGKSREEILSRLTFELMSKHQARRLYFGMLWAFVRHAATSALSHQRGGRRGASKHKAEIKKEWLAWQSQPERFESPGAFKTAMELRFHGASSGTISNWITEWRSELSRQ